MSIVNNAIMGHITFKTKILNCIKNTNEYEKNIVDVTIDAKLSKCRIISESLS